ncbi:carbon monoxide dehydrogenase medium chain [bacterium MnTg02]|nr:carbon monoxide dehydrogenase medium chain [bacterium MnTg02]
MYDFRYHRPATISEAVDLFRQCDDGQYLAGGQTLIPVMKQRLASPSDLIDLARIDELKDISATESAITIGGMTTHAAIAASSEVRSRLAALADLASGIGDPHVRNRGTLGGSIANNDPTADYPAAIVALGATIITDRRRIEGDAFFTNIFETALEEGELIRAVEFPIPERAAYAKFPNPASRYAIAGVMVSKFADIVRVAVTGAGPFVFRVPDMEAALARDFSPEAIEKLQIPAGDLNADLHASPAYRAHLVSILAKRAVQAAKE